jgi:hypothetical protein
MVSRSARDLLNLVMTLPTVGNGLLDNRIKSKEQVLHNLIMLPTSGATVKANRLKSYVPGVLADSGSGQVLVSVCEVPHG